MRFDNPIYDHGFVFPDIADFPDILHEKRYRGNGNEEYVSVMKEGLQKGDLHTFERGYQWYMKKPDVKLFNKLNVMFKFYNDFEESKIENNLPSNEIYEDLYENGISYKKIDIKELRDRVDQEIKNLIVLPDWRPPQDNLIEQNNWVQRS